ncbi:MAG: class I SAM-dependent methyltransferase [Euryarchaeota archaeon]|nr:class I SAM-dependent methyltransferase [Euryarchaeota archaeon]
MRNRIDRALYPLAWEASYGAKGAQWRGSPNYSGMLGELDLSGPVLEMGVGNGNTASRVLGAMPEGASLLCLDVARGALRTLPPALRADARVRLLQSDVRELPFKGDALTTVLACHILTHMLHGDEGKLLSEVERALKPGGRALIEVFAPGDMRFGTGEEIEPKTFMRADGLITRFYDEEELRVALEGTGFNIVKLETVSRAVRHGRKAFSRESMLAIAERRQ